MSETEQRVILFTCNWNAYSGLESAGLEHKSYPASVRPIKVMCLGRLSAGIMLKALEKGADGVLLLGCPPGECHYEFGNQRVEEAFAQAKEMAVLLGYGEKRLGLDWVDAGDGEAFATKLQAFLAGLNGNSWRR